MSICIYAYQCFKNHAMYAFFQIFSAFSHIPDAKRVYFMAASFSLRRHLKWMEMLKREGGSRRKSQVSLFSSLSIFFYSCELETQHKDKLKMMFVCATQLFKISGRKLMKSRWTGRPTRRENNWLFKCKMLQEKALSLKASFAGSWLLRIRRRYLQ